MIDPGSARSLEASRAFAPPSRRSPGKLTTGAHHPSRMLPSPAPTRMAMRSPSPVFDGAPTGRVTGPRRKSRTSAVSYSNPPVASTTAPARTSRGPSGVWTAAPVTARPQNAGAAAERRLADEQPAGGAGDAVRPFAEAAEGDEADLD